MVKLPFHPKRKVRKRATIRNRYNQAPHLTKTDTIKHHTWPRLIFTGLSKAVLHFVDPFLLFVFHVCLCYSFLPVPCSLVITCWERVALLALLYVVFSCILSLSHMVSWVRCGTWLYRILIFAFPFTCISATLTLNKSRLLFTSAEVFKKPLLQTVWTQIRLLLTEQSALGPRYLLRYLLVRQ